MAKLERKAFAIYLGEKFTLVLADAVWFKVGEHMEDLSVNLNPDVSSIKNVWGETRVTDNGYEPSIDADPYYANPEQTIYKKIRDIALDRKTGDNCKTYILEVIVEDDAATNHLAYVEEVIVKPQSYGGDISGVNIPYNISYNGNRKKGYVTAASITAGAPVFAAGEIPTT